MSERRGRMTVRDLICKLNGLPQDAPVFIYGYEGGYDDVLEIYPIRVELNMNTSWYYGAHEMICGGEDVGSEKAVDGFVIR